MKDAGRLQETDIRINKTKQSTKSDFNGFSDVTENEVACKK